MKISVCHLILLPLLLLFCCHCLAAVNKKADADNQQSIYKTKPHFKAMRSDLKVTEKTSKDHFLTPNSSRADFPCPVAAAIAPCTCAVDSDNRVLVDCTYVESEDQLVEVFQQEFPVKELYRFSMANTNFNAIEWFPSFMNGITFESVYLYPGPFILKGITEHFLFDLKDTLKEFVVSSSRLTTDLFPFYLLSSMNQLESLQISFSDINWIPPILAPKLTFVALEFAPIDLLESGTFPIETGPMTIWIIYNQIHTIEAGSFFFADQDSADSNELIHIDAYNNQIQSLKAGTFPLRNGLMSIHLDSNQISSIEPGTFILPASTGFLILDLDLRFNNLTTVDEAVFESLMPFTTYLGLQGNLLTCGCDIAWLILNEAYLATVNNGATCADGTNLHDLDPQQYIDFC